MQIAQLFRIFLKKVVIMAMVEEKENNLIWIASGKKIVGTVTYYCNQVSALWVGWWLRYAFRVHWHQVQKYSSSFLFWHIYIHTLTEVHHIYRLDDLLMIEICKKSYHAAHNESSIANHIAVFYSKQRPISGPQWNISFLYIRLVHKKLCYSPWLQLLLIHYVREGLLGFDLNKI